MKTNLKSANPETESSELANLDDFELPNIFAISTTDLIPGGIHVPDELLAIRADCSGAVGKFKLGTTPFKGSLKMRILKAEKFIGSFSAETKEDVFLQIFFLDESGVLPADQVMVVYFHGRSLDAFQNLVNFKMAIDKVNPLTGLFLPVFTKYRSTAFSSDYYGVEWDWEPDLTPERKRALAVFMRDPQNMAKMVDKSIEGRLFPYKEVEDTTALPPSEDTKQLTGNEEDVPY